LANLFYKVIVTNVQKTNIGTLFVPYRPNSYQIKSDVPIPQAVNQTFP